MDVLFESRARSSWTQQKKKNEMKSSDRQWDGMHRERAKRFVVDDPEHIGPRKLMHYACSLGEKRFLSQNFSLCVESMSSSSLFFSAQNSH
jgi:hypothetical protein